MSVLDHRLDRILDDPDGALREPEWRRPSAWVVAPAAVAAWLVVSAVTDIAHGAMAAAIVAVVAFAADRLVTFSLGLDWRPRWQIASIAAMSGSLAGVGASLYDTGGSAAGTLANGTIAWVAVGFFVQRERSAGEGDGDRSGGIEALARLSSIATIGLCVVSALVPSLDRLAIAACAPAAGLTIFAALTARGRRSPDHVTVATRAVLAGAGAAALALATPHHSSTLTLAAATAVPAIVAWTMITRSRGSAIPVSVSVIGIVVMCVLAGGATGPIAIVALASAYAATVRVGARVATMPADEPRHDDASTASEVRDVATRRLVVGLTAVAFGLRLLAGRGLWLDEATSVHQARMPFLAMLQDVYKDDNHPPLHHILLWLDLRLVGDSELALRLPAVLFGALLVPMLYLTGRALFGRRVGAIAAAIGAVAPIAVWYGQEARMYSQFMLLSLVSVYSLIRIMRTGDRRFWIAFTLSSVALMYTQYFAVLHVGATMLVLFIEWARRRRASPATERRRSSLGRGLVISAVTQVILMAPLVPWILHQAARNQQEGFGFSTTGISGGSDVVPPPGIYGLLTNVQWAIFGYQSNQLTERLVALWPIGLLLLLFMLGRERRVATRYLILIAGLPIAVVFAASFVAAKSRSLAEVRYFAGAVPMLFILLAAGLVTVVTSRRAQQLVFGGLIVSMLVAVGLQETSTDNPRLYQYREAVEEVRDLAGPGDVVLYAPFYMNYVLEYYNPGVVTARADDALPATPGRVFLVEATSFAGSGESDQEIDGALQQLRRRGMDVVARHDFAQVTVWEVG